MTEGALGATDMQDISMESFLGTDREVLKKLQETVERNIELYKITKEQLNRITVIYELTKAIISIGDFDELLRKISEDATKLFNATGCMIRLIEGDELKIRASFGFPEDVKDAITVRIGEGIAGKAALEGKTILAKNPEEFGAIAPNIKIQTAICTPLKIGSQIIGTFGIFDKMSPDGNIVSFTQDDIITLEGLASIVAIVIDKSILYENALRQEREAIEAKNRIEELKDYLQGLIENSADAIVTSDLKGIVTSWNIGAEKIYGYKKQEAIGMFLPFIPDFLVETEKSYTERVKRGETLKDIETVRRTKDGRLIDVSLTLSPIKDSNGNVIGVSGIARDITEKKRIEKELLRKNNELSRLFFISSAMRGTLELDKLLRMVLTAVTMGDGLGFNRAMLFLLDDNKNLLKGAMGVGPSSHEEAWQIWSRLSMEHKNLHSLINEIDDSPLRKDSFIDRLCCGIEISLDEDTILTRAVKEKKAFNVTDVHSEPLSDPVLIQQLGTMAYAVVPLISRDRVIGILWVDNLFSRRPITEHDMEFLKGFTDQIASAIENARLFEHVAQAEQELENIFESISDYLYVTDINFTVRKVNKAVVELLNRPVDEIVGKKSFEVFRDVSEQWSLCAYKEEIKGTVTQELFDPKTGKTYLISCSPVLNKSRDVIGSVHLIKDITEMKVLREKVASAQRMAALGEMAAKVAHEIRNPLLSIGGFARRLEKRLDGDLKENARIIVNEVQRLEGILNDTLSFVKSARLNKKLVDINEIIDGIINLMEPTVYDRGNALIKEIEYPVEAFIDYDRIKEAVLNIVNNANQATDNGSIMIRAYVRKTYSDSETDLFEHRREKKEAVIEVEDTGCGIRKEDIDRVFDPFFTTRPTGTGLGLSITKRIIEEHGGKIEVESVWGKGTKFKIYLPLEEE
ncbi:sensor histidine kinase [Dissulfurispira thermophila]|uniref:histidine kinase n=1 Tax=Dissulfurispira thermophila TaxID=2715679 RepID=A0A7G1H5H3_9BACT|nr:PAS domain S-box protein [Dissulfurispira thermophila]BCB97342.1 sensor histidine kinase [Dissulfurispira thermophila]